MKRATCLSALAMLIAGLVSGCFIRDIRQANAMAAANHRQQVESIKLPMFVIAEGARVCPSRDVSPTCEGGLDLALNEYLDASADGELHSVMYIHEGGVTNGYVPSAALGELPKLDAYKRTVDELIEVQAGTPLIAGDELIYQDLMSRPDAFAGRELRMFPQAAQLDNLRVDGQVTSFTLPVPSTPMRDSTSPVRFEFRNEAWADEFRRSKKKFTCGPNYCDQVAVVAELTDRQHEAILPGGIVIRMPVFEVTLLVDRFGAYVAA